MKRYRAKKKVAHAKELSKEELLERIEMLEEDRDTLWKAVFGKKYERPDMVETQEEGEEEQEEYEEEAIWIEESSMCIYVCLLKIVNTQQLTLWLYWKPTRSWVNIE